MYLADRLRQLFLEGLGRFSVDYPVAGIFFFIPYIVESGILDIVKECFLPASREIGARGAALSMLVLKLMGNERLSNIKSYDHEPGLGIFAGLTLLPKTTYMNMYSCLTSKDMVNEFQMRVIERFREKYPSFYESDVINLDFHSIPYYGKEETMEKAWCGARGKVMKGANTVFAQDGESNVIMYTRADILRREEAAEIKKFISYWQRVNGKVNETLVFDGKFTKYSVLDELTDMGIRFVTLRRRFASLLDQTDKTPSDEWERVHLSIPKRKYNNLLVHEGSVALKHCTKPLRQIIVKGNGRANFTYILTNNMVLTVLEIYAN